MQARISTTQIGAIGEHIAASQLMLTSQGRLTPFLPMADDDGIDLLIFDKKTRATLPIQIKSRTAIDGSTRGTVQFDVRRKTMSDDTYLLALLFDWQAGVVRRAWLLAMSQLEKVSVRSANKFSIRPSPKDTSRDRYTPYRYNGLPSVSVELMGIFDGFTQDS
jgi:hypothetical protein